MDLTCPACSNTIRLSQPRLYSAGFSNLGFLYCDACPTILEFSVYNPKYTQIVGDKHPWMLSDEEKSRVERSLAPCPNGGRFRFGAFPRCPFCAASISALMPDEIHFVEVGDVVNGDEDLNVWLPDGSDSGVNVEERNDHPA